MSKVEVNNQFSAYGAFGGSFGDIADDIAPKARRGGGCGEGQQDTKMAGGGKDKPSTGRKEIDDAITRWAFQQLDGDADQVLDGEELSEVPELYKAMPRLDRNKDGGLKLDELLDGLLERPRAALEDDEETRPHQRHTPNKGQAASQAPGTGKGEGPGKSEGKGEEHRPGEDEAPEEAQGPKGEGPHEGQGSDEGEDPQEAQASQQGKGFQQEHRQGPASINDALREFAFNQLDANRDGKISSTEAAKAPGLYALFQQLDKNKDGKISKEEFLGRKPAGEDEQDPKEAMKKFAFKKLDKDGDGKLTAEEAAQSPGIYEQFAKMDTDQDGAVSEKEFLGKKDGDDPRAGIRDFAFRKLDTNGDGKLSSQEVAKAPGIYKNFFELDKDRNGTISREEFNASPRQAQPIFRTTSQESPEALVSNQELPDLSAMMTTLKPKKIDLDD